MMNHFVAAILNASDVDLPQTEASSSTIRGVLSFVFVLAGAIAVLMVVIGGIRYTISVGDPQKITAAKNTIIYALVGLVISLSAFVMVRFVFDAIDKNPTEESIGIVMSAREVL